MVGTEADLGFSAVFGIDSVHSRRRPAVSAPLSLAGPAHLFHWPPLLESGPVCIFHQISRSNGQEQFLMIFLILALSIGLFNANAARTINRNTEDSIRCEIGADHHAAGVLAKI
jgi:hypothetical protein